MKFSWVFSFLSVFSLSAAANVAPDDAGAADRAARRADLRHANPRTLQSGDGGDQGNDDAQCFAGDSIVTVLGKGDVLMQDLKLGDSVKVGPNTYSPVYSFLHKDADMVADFLEIRHSGGVPLQVTPKHMVYLADQTVVAAMDVKINDVLLGGNGQELVVHDIKEIVKAGVYAPATHSGRVVVSDVVSSSYPVVVSFASAGFQHAFLHAFFSPHRLLCQVTTCESEQYYSGYNWMVSTFQPVVQVAEKIVSSEYIVSSAQLGAMVAFYIAYKKGTQKTW